MFFFDLFSGDELFLEPMSGELKPNSHCNIKMTLLPGKYPCNFEGEIQCSIDWENEDRRALDEARSVATNTNVPEVSEFLFIRLKKRAKIVSSEIPVPCFSPNPISFFARPKCILELTFVKASRSSKTS